MRFLSFLARLIRPKPKANAQAAAVLAASEPIRLAFAPGEAPTLKSSTCKVVPTGIPVVDLSALPSDSLELLKSRSLISADTLAAARVAAVPLDTNTTNP